LLLASCYDHQATDLGEAASLGDMEQIRKLVASGVDVNGCVGYEGCDRPLGSAAAKGQLEAVKFLVEHGAKINIGQINAVYWAARFGKADVVRYLLSQGGRLVCDQGNLTALKRDMTAAGWSELEAEVEKTWVAPGK
jgi:ankyrin repeat protein